MDPPICVGKELGDARLVEASLFDVLAGRSGVVYPGWLSSEGLGVPLIKRDFSAGFCHQFSPCMTCPPPLQSQLLSPTFCLFVVELSRFLPPSGLADP